MSRSRNSSRRSGISCSRPTIPGGLETIPFGPEDVRRVRATVAGVSERGGCRILQVCRATLHRHPKPSMPSRRLSPTLTARLQELLTQHPTFGYRRLWALLRYREGLVVNRKVVYRILKLKGWLVHQRACTPRPRVRGWRSRANERNRQTQCLRNRVRYNRFHHTRKSKIIGSHPAGANQDKIKEKEYAF